MAHSLICRTAPNLPKMSYISSADMLNGRLRTYSILRSAADFFWRSAFVFGSCWALKRGTKRLDTGCKTSDGPHLVTSGGSR